MIDGLAGIKDSAAFGIHAHGSNTLISNNNLEYIGYNGISFAGENSKVTNNFVNHFCQKKDDGGGIYTWDDSGSGKQILDNIVMHGTNHNEGIDESSKDFHAHGIYIDGSDNVAIYRNTIAHNEGSGIFLNTQALGMDVQNNTAFDNVRGIQIISNIHGGGEITGLIMKNNIFVAKESNQRTLMYVTSSGDSAVRQLGFVDYNYYARPTDDSNTITTQIYAWSGPTTLRTLAEWQSYSTLDAHSKKSPKAISSTSDLRFEYNPNSSTKTISLDRNYIDVKGTNYSGSVTLQPYSSIVLIKN
jgi:parallel beta-helix repeat protein